MGTRLGAGLYEIGARHLFAGDSRGIGLIQGLEIRLGVREGNVLRLAPPLSVSPAQVDEALHTLDDALRSQAGPIALTPVGTVRRYEPHAAFS